MDKERRTAFARRVRAASAAFAMHAKHPEAARINGRRGAQVTMARYGGPTLWGEQMARRRWSGKRIQLQPISPEEVGDAAS
jgi:hypothetical protein